MSGYYPAGVTGNEPQISGPGEAVVQVECDGEEATVVPSLVVTPVLADLRYTLNHMMHLSADEAALRLPGILKAVEDLTERVEELEDNADFECPFDGDVDMQFVGPNQRWTCPVCAKEHEESIPDPREYDAP